jgi:hypothetical protein
MQNVTDKDLKNEIVDMRERFPRLQDSELFIAWFLKCFITDKEDDAVAALVGGPRDKSLDAIFLDDPSKTVFLIQGKYRQRNNEALEHRSDVTAFASLASTFSDAQQFSSYLKGLDPAVAGKAQEARKRIRSRGYRLQLYYVTTGRCSTSLADEADRTVRQANAPSSIEVIDGKRILRLLSDYLDGVAPPVPLLELEIENGQGIKLDGVLQRFDGNTGIESWVFPVNVRHIADMFEQSGIRLFARNVRGFLGETAINKNMEQTLENEPEFFWYYNNGITIICDSAEKSSRGGRNVLRVVNPQVINGQQTTRTLHGKAGKNPKAAVLVRVISVPRENDQESTRFERNLRKLDYQYLRKRQTKSEARRHAGVRHRFFVSKEELAQAVAACDLDPSIVREGKERLFEERNYDHVFPNADPNYYLPRHWLVWNTSFTARGYPQRAYAKWVVTHFVWQHLEKILRTRALKELFSREHEKWYYEPLTRACIAAYKGALAFYRARRGKGEKAIDISTFFQRRGLHTELEKFWAHHSGGHRQQFKRALSRFRTEFLKTANSA